MVRYGQVLHIHVFFPAMTRIHDQGFPPPVVGPVRCRPEGDPLILDEGAPRRRASVEQPTNRYLVLFPARASRLVIQETGSGQLASALRARHPIHTATAIS